MSFIDDNWELIDDLDGAWNDWDTSNIDNDCDNDPDYSSIDQFDN